MTRADLITGSINASSAHPNAARFVAAFAWVCVLMALLLISGCVSTAEPVAEPAPAAPASAAVEPSGPDARSTRLAALEALARRLRTATRTELASEWAQAARDPRSAKQALLLLHPASPQPDEDLAFDIMERLDAAERRIILRGYAAFVADQRRADERQRDNLGSQLERTRKELREESRKVDAVSARVEQEKQRADALAGRVDELQRTLARLREIDKRLIDRSRPQVPAR
jgi:hypothetical protein